ncbi:uncharacterized protein BBA_04928 [Beauveria bassiana ARSEF 2860]|uniref:Integral membrane protein n=1 Tax=Beauveria bassiana (strain ARSEF 2860) TaxID=655819 RepID=J4UMB5_BEAB2|nr:uncharacterized protein BBA_04928 [Beauveria bassiana ARSEF 2860]EJP65957.1 hypothetical protein BBA_04928 [Beauveria bassiana ARSEF 2860]
MVERSANSLAYAMGWLYAAAVFAFAAYVWTRCKAKRWRLDDYFYTASFLLYLLSLGFARISCALFVSAAAQASPLVWPARTAAALSGSWSIASVLCLTLHDGKPWEGILGESFYLRWVGIEATGILIELALFILSISLIWFLAMPKLRRTCLMAAFSTRLLLIPIIAARLVHLHSSSHRSSPTSVTPSILTEAALALSIVTGCATTPRSLLAAIPPPPPPPTHHVFNRPLTIYTYDRYRRIRKSNRSTSAWTRRFGAGVVRPEPTPDLAWLPYQGFSEMSEATAYPPRVHISSMSREAPLMTPMEEELWRMTIQKTTEVSVEHRRRSHLHNLGRQRHSSVTSTL